MSSDDVRRSRKHRRPPPSETGSLPNDGQWMGLSSALAWTFTFQSALYSRYTSSSVNDKEVPFTVPSLRRLQSIDRTSSDGRLPPSSPQLLPGSVSPDPSSSLVDAPLPRTHSPLPALLLWRSPSSTSRRMYMLSAASKSVQNLVKQQQQHLLASLQDERPATAGAGSRSSNADRQFLSVNDAAGPPSRSMSTSSSHPDQYLLTPNYSGDELDDQETSSESMWRKASSVSCHVLATPSRNVRKASHQQRSLDVKFVIPRSPSVGHKFDTHLEAIATVREQHRLRKISNTSLGSLNPDLYKSTDDGDVFEYPEGHIGRVWFNVDYDKGLEKLSVTLIKARNLPSRDLMNPNACDPFFRLVVLPEERRKIESKVKRKSPNPNFGEVFSFEVPLTMFDKSVLKMIALDVDVLKRHNPIGAILFPLEDYTRCKQQKLTVWRDLKRDGIELQCQLGELHCSLCYNPTKTLLNVTVIEVKDLKPPEDTVGIDCYAKTVLSVATKTVKTKKSKVVKKTFNPSFNDSADFKLAVDKLDQASVAIEIFQVKPDRLLARTILGGQSIASGKQLQHWQDMLSKPREPVTSWHFLTE